MSTGPARRTAGAVNQHRAANHHRLERPDAFAGGAVRRRRQRFARRRRIGQRLCRILRADCANHRGQDHDDEERCETSRLREPVEQANHDGLQPTILSPVEGFRTAVTNTVSDGCLRRTSVSWTIAFASRSGQNLPADIRR